MLRRAPILSALSALVLGQGLGMAGPLHDAVSRGNFSESAEILRDSPPDVVNEPLHGGATALHIAAAKNRLDLLILLLKHGAEFNAKTHNGFTPLHWAAGRDAARCVEYLIIMGADIDRPTDHGITPLHWAARRDATNVVALLLSLGVDTQAETGKGLRPLHWAIRDSADHSAVMLAVSETMTRIEAGEGDNATDIASAPMEEAITGRLDRVAFWEPLRVPLGEGRVMRFEWTRDLRMWVGKHEISNAQFLLFESQHDSGHHDQIVMNDPDQPVVKVTWTLARTYCRWLTEMFGDGLPDGYIFRLPTEAEWTAFARCGTQRKYPWGDEFPPKYGNYSDIAARDKLANWRGIDVYDDGFAVTCPVEESGENEWGLFGVGGNVWEWCSDWYEDTQLYRVRRGGSWFFDGEISLRVDYRGFDLPGAKYDTIGFRVVAGPIASEIAASAASEGHSDQE